MKREFRKIFSFIEKISLIKLRLKAIRSGLWFKALSRIDRVLVNLTIQVANDNVCSTTLVTQLLSITSKLGNLIESGLSRATKEIGFQTANKFSVFAQSWGNKIARKWASEFGFARYLAVMKINSGYNVGSI